MLSVVDRHSDRCVVAMTSSDHSLINQTRYLMCGYANSIGADFKICDFKISDVDISVSRNKIITQCLNSYWRLIVMDDTCCINKRTPNLFDLISDQELGRTQDSSILVISKQHQFLFSSPIDDSLIQQYQIRQHILDIKFSQSSIAVDPQPYQLTKRILDPEYINQQYIINVTQYYQYQSFYISHICEIYTDRYYYHPLMDFDANLVGDLIEEIDRLKKIRKTKFNMLVFGLGYDSLLWFHKTDWKIWFIDTGGFPIPPEIPANQIIPYTYPEINVMTSFIQSHNFKLPRQLKNVTFDLILIQGPASRLDTDPGILIPVYWSAKYLTHQGSIIYLRHCDRLLEHYCIDTYLNRPDYKELSQFDATTKLVRTP